MRPSPDDVCQQTRLHVAVHRAQWDVGTFIGAGGQWSTGAHSSSCWGGRGLEVGPPSGNTESDGWAGFISWQPENCTSKVKVRGRVRALSWDPASTVKGLLGLETLHTPCTHAAPTYHPLEIHSFLVRIAFHAPCQQLGSTPPPMGAERVKNMSSCQHGLARQTQANDAVLLVTGVGPAMKR